MLKSVQEKQRFTTGSHGWLAAASCQKLLTCQAYWKLKRHASWSTTGQNRTTGRLVTSRLELATQSSREAVLFWKTWLFTFHSHPSINTHFTHERKRASRENFKRETLEKNKIDSSPIFIKSLFKFLNSLPLHCKILERLITKTFSHYNHFYERAVWCFGKQLWGNQFHIGWCYGQVVESGKLEKKWV